MAFRTEDQVRNEAGITLGFIDSSGNNVDTSEYLSGVGAINNIYSVGFKTWNNRFCRNQR